MKRTLASNPVMLDRRQSPSMKNSSRFGGAANNGRLQNIESNVSTVLIQSRRNGWRKR